MADCSRPRCTLAATKTIREPHQPPRQVCEKHWEHSPLAGYAPSAPVKRHIELLTAKGISLQTIAQLADIDKSTLTKLGEWTPNAATQTRVANGILAIDVPTHFVESRRLVPAIGTIRRIQALMAIGYSQRMIGQRLNRSQSAVQGWMGTDFVFSVTAARMQRLFWELELTPGPSRIAARYARQQGWAPPLAWDEDTIDDPDAEPSIAPKKTTVQWHTELSAEGYTFDQIAAELNLKRESLLRALNDPKRQAS